MEVGYFVQGDADTAFARSLGNLVGKKNREAIGQFLSSRNIHRFKHGKQWTHPGSPLIEPGEFQQHSTSAETRFEDIASHNLSVVTEFIAQITSGLHAEFMKTMYATVTEACDRSGNTVDMKRDNKTLPESVYLMLEKLEFGVDDDGNVSLPQIHAHPDMVRRLIEVERDATPEFQARIKALIEQKSEDARAKESQRRAKFVNYGASQ